jgi:hypothetical protein
LLSQAIKLDFCSFFPCTTTGFFSWSLSDLAFLDPAEIIQQKTDMRLGYETRRQSGNLLKSRTMLELYQDFAKGKQFVLGTLKVSLEEEGCAFEEHIYAVAVGCDNSAGFNCRGSRIRLDAYMPHPFWTLSWQENVRLSKVVRCHR